MKDSEKQMIREKIEADLVRLKQDITGLEKLTSPEALEGLDDVDRMDAIVSKSVHDAALAAARSREVKLEYALKRVVDDPEFGYCVDCGEKIPMPRLLSMPEAARCVNCAE